MNLVEVAEFSLFLGGMLMNIFILPTVLNTEASVPRKQSVPTAVVLVSCFTLPYLYLDLYLPAAATFIGALLWGYVAANRPLPPG